MAAVQREYPEPVTGDPTEKDLALLGCYLAIKHEMGLIDGDTGNDG